ncbi:MAG: hypothetical protein P8163_22245 [Candidatus Thiodiazotropha sp.]
MDIDFGKKSFESIDELEADSETTDEPQYIPLVSRRLIERHLELKRLREILDDPDLDENLD